MTRKASLAIRERLASNLKSFRQARGYTQEDVGKRCGLHKNYISNIEQATVNISLASLEALARGIGCSLSQLLA